MNTEFQGAGIVRKGSHCTWSKQKVYRFCEQKLEGDKLAWRRIEGLHLESEVKCDYELFVTAGIKFVHCLNKQTGTPGCFEAGQWLNSNLV